MLHTKFRANRPTCSFKGCLPYTYICGGYLGHGTQMPREETFVSPTHRGSTQILALIGQAVWEKMFESVDVRRRRTTDGRRSMGIRLAHLVSPLLR